MSQSAVRVELLYVGCAHWISISAIDFETQIDLPALSECKVQLQAQQVLMHDGDSLLVRSQHISRHGHHLELS